MRLQSQKSMLFKSSVSPKKPLKQPKQLITKLNTDIQTIQNSIRHYNEIEKRSVNWKQQMNFTVYNCQLKTLSQPKLQNILLESNFVNSMTIFGKNINQSAVKNSTIKLKNSKNKNYMMNSSGLGFRKTMSMKVDGSYNNNRKIMNDQNEMRKSQKSIGANNLSRAYGQFIEENPQLSFVDTRPQFNSFREQIAQNKSSKKIDDKKIANNRLLNKGKVSALSSMSKTLQKCPSKNMNSDSTMFDQYLMKDNQTLIEDQSQSIMMQTSTRLFSQQFQNPKPKALPNTTNISKQLNLIPISEQKTITLASHRKSKTIRQQIQQKTIRLEKQWLLTECYREKFNIMPSTTKDQSRVSQCSQNKVKRSVSKLANIIQKVEGRRPGTSMTQKSRQTTLEEDVTKQQKGKTIHVTKFCNEQTHLNISTFGF